MNNIKVVQLRLNKHDKDMLQAKAKAQLMTLSDYVRLCLNTCDGYSNVNDAINGLNYQINHLLINLNQLQSLAIINKQDTKNIEAAVRECKNLRNIIGTMYRRE